ncbi:MAG: KH domain-containing protein [Silvanigrellaceae bacterium]|nr:KH domain-containing protein [Silvanigrellaceae bacterium]
MVSSHSASIRDLISFIACSLVDNADQVEINEVEGTQTSVIELRVAKEDIGKIIGKSGRTADAIRTILGCASAKNNKRYILQILDK